MLKSSAKLLKGQIIYEGEEGLKKIIAKHLPKINSQEKQEMANVTKMMPFKTNNYVVEELIDWKNYHNDPIFNLIMPNSEMLKPEEHELFAKKGEKEAVSEIIHKWNPHGGSMQMANVPCFDEMDEYGVVTSVPINGLQHKYETTCLYFSNHCQECFNYCNYCFRWSQFHKEFVNIFEMEDPTNLLNYVEGQKKLTDILCTGGDAGMLGTKDYEQIFYPLMGSSTTNQEAIDFTMQRFGKTFEVDHIQNIRIGTRSLTFWPHRWIDDKDSADNLELIEKLNNEPGKQIYIMSHLSHAQELSTPTVEKAIKNLRNAGCEIRSQSPCIRNVNDSEKAWADKWKRELQLGITPYYMFIPRETGPAYHFALPLERIHEIFKGAINSVSGLAKTVRGPSMSCKGGKIGIRDLTTIKGEKVFVLEYFQGRNPNWCGKLYFAKYDPHAISIEELTPAFGEKEFFFSQELRDWENSVRHLKGRSTRNNVSMEC